MNAARGYEEKSYSTLNSVLRFIVLYANVLFTIIGLALMAFSLYAIFANWGSLDKSFFVGVGIVGVLLGFDILLVSIVGFTGVLFNEEYNGPWSRRRILAIYEFVVVGALAAVIYLLTTAVIAVFSLRSTLNKLSTDDYIPPFTTIETSFSNRFNSFYFAAAQACGDKKFDWFWGFINDHCGPEMSQLNCEECAGNPLTRCQPSYNGCIVNGDELTCPYDICRSGVIDYLIHKIKPFSIGVCVVLGVLALIAIMTCMLICYTPRDDLSTQLYKSGTLSGEKYNAERNARMKLRTGKV